MIRSIPGTQMPSIRHHRRSYGPPRWWRCLLAIEDLSTPEVPRWRVRLSCMVGVSIRYADTLPEVAAATEELLGHHGDQCAELLARRCPRCLAYRQPANLRPESPIRHVCRDTEACEGRERRRREAVDTFADPMHGTSYPRW